MGWATSSAPSPAFWGGGCGPLLLSPPRFDAEQVTIPWIRTVETAGFSPVVLEWPVSFFAAIKRCFSSLSPLKGGDFNSQNSTPLKQAGWGVLGDELRLP